ncbi:hypothetical protein [Ensifer adhaerens]|uniref:hypothetical protein n=1 Tax=Ensifer adhaerens TaxID=106592 RepID=UPI000DD6561F|nr:hypothetical protein [Ensifer adhaerens]
MLEKIVYAALAVGVVVIGAGATYIVQFEGRISKLEAQVNFAFGATASASGEKDSNTEDQAATNGKASGTGAALTDTQSARSELSLALATSCAKLIETYNDIVAKNDALYSTEEARLDALTSQLDKLGCTQALVSAKQTK